MFMISEQPDLNAVLQWYVLNSIEDNRIIYDQIN